MKKYNALFVGKHGSMGLINGYYYLISLSILDYSNIIIVTVWTEDSEYTKLKIPYSNLDTFLSNWANVNHV